MKTLMYTFLAAMSLSLISCEKDNVDDRENLVTNQMEKKEGDEEEEFLISGLITANSTGIPEPNIDVKILNTSSNEVEDEATSNQAGEFTLIVPEGNYFFKLYEGETLIYTSGGFNIVANSSVHLMTP